MAQPNIILINCDDLGYGDIGCYGSTDNATPRLDRMAAEGARFTDFHMAAPVCTPSRAAMMTGCYPARNGMDCAGERGWVLFPADPRGLHPNEITVATSLKRAGYATALVGKWHLGDQPEFLPTNHGFDEYFGIPYSNDMGLEKGNGDKRERYVPTPVLEAADVAEAEPDQATLTARYTERCVEFIRRNRDRPFFLYFGHMYVHLPLYPDPRFVDGAAHAYGAEVACIDWSTGVILDALGELGLDDNTLVIWTSDNGSNLRDGASNGPLRGGKGSMWEGGMRLPCIARWPGRIPAGTVSGELCTAMDFLPTFAALAGAEVPTDRVIDGRDISPLLFGEPGAMSPHEAFFHYDRDELRCVRAGDWKLHFIGRELYNLAEDVGETNNVAADHPDVIAELEAIADKCRQDLGDARTGVEGANRRPMGWVDDPKPLVEWVEAEYSD